MQTCQVLIAEDDSFSQMAVKMLLTSLRRDAVIAPDGAIAIKLFKEKQGNFSLILMDLQMPNVDGFEASKKIREAERAMGIGPIKIFGISADNDETTKKKCLSSGMDGLLAKPLKKDILSQLF